MYLVGVDVGTTNTKAVVFDPESGAVRAVGRSRTVARRPRPEWSEFEADELWSAVARAIRDAATAIDDPRRIRAVAVASMGEAGFPVDQGGEVLYPAIAWHDPRTQAEAEWWETTLGARRVYEISGQVVHPMYGVNKLMWLRANRPGVYRRVRWWLSIEDFVLWKLSGVMATDRSVASRTMVFDQRTLEWSNELLGHAGIPREWFPPVYPSGTPLGTITPAAAEETGLPPDTLVVVGGHDHFCGALAAGFRPGLLLDSTGTAAAVLALQSSFQPAAQLLVGAFDTYAFVLPETFVTLGSLSFAGGALEWLIAILYGEVGPGNAAGAGYVRAVQEASRVPPGARGVLVLPYFLGTGTPYGHRPARGAIVGLGPSHGRAEIVRALMEALAFWLRDNIEALGRAGVVTGAPEIIAIGGGNEMPGLAQIKADVTGRRVVAPRLVEAVATGAALLAGIGAGGFASWIEAAQGVASERAVHEPDPAARALYERVLERSYGPVRDAYLANQSALVDAATRG
jgi:xylulokinase